MRLNIWKSILLLTCGLLLTGAQDEPSSSGTPVDSQGEEVFGADYLPYAPVTDAVPLEPGSPAAGFDIDALANPQPVLSPGRTGRTD